jgi:copper chaperone CopZ
MGHQLALKISGMHCDACVRRVRAALEKLPGVTVEDVRVGLARLRTADGEPDREVIHTAIRKTGFAVESEEEES